MLASIGFAGSNSLYDALLVDVTSAERFHQVSALGFGLGYLGGSLLFVLNIWMVSSPATFGLGSEVEAIRLAFILVAIWWVIFSIPLLLWVHEREELHEHRSVMEGILLFVDTMRKIGHDRNLVLFLVAYWLYIDGVYTIIKMAVDFGLSQGLSMQDLIRAILVTNLIGFPAALLFGRLGLAIGAKMGLYIGYRCLFRHYGCRRVCYDGCGVLCTRCLYRPRAGRCAESESFVVRSPDSGRSQRRLFWFLQHAR